ncbi:MAG TPA: carboxymuconolactone decarboxylase family protein [Pirellulales bacterium]|jgi:AhpD family alkylhydroperoxidase
MSTRANYYVVNRPAADALSAVNTHITSIDPKLRTLVELRISQINGCVYCVNMHSNQAREHGESQQRLDCLAAWYECKFFDDAEHAALAWAEALTDISHTHAPDNVYDALTQHYSEQQIVDLTLIISMMNAWNRIAIAHRAHPSKS